MSVKALLFATLALASATAAAEDFKISELLQSKEVQSFLDPNIKLYWGNEPTPQFAEISPPDSYTRSDISISPFGGSRRHCVGSFEKTLRAMIADARKWGYDAIINIRPVQPAKSLPEGEGFSCTPGYKTTEVRLTASLAMSPAAQQRYKEAEERPIAPREPAKGAIFLPLEPILTSPEAKAILGGLKAHWGANPPTYVQRYGPDRFTEEAKIGELSKEQACKQATLNSLAEIVEDVKERKLDGIINIRSFLNGAFAPNLAEVECELDKKEATVTLRASLVKMAKLAQ